MIRLYLESPLSQGKHLILSREEAHYLTSVMRLKEGREVHPFNGVDGQWRASLVQVHKKEVVLAVLEQEIPPRKRSRRVHAVLAPLKQKRLEVALEKLTELDVSDIHFVLTQHTQIRALNHERLALIAKEAAEQSERLDVPVLHEPLSFDPWVDSLAAAPLGEVLLLADERQGEKTILGALEAVSPAASVAFVVGPEGGFAQEERARLKALPQVIPVTLGKGILRAETAAILMAGALTCLGQE